MSSADLLAGTVMDASAAMLNDTAKSIYTYAKQVPYLNMALLELQEIFELNEVPVTDTYSAVMQVDAGIDYIGFAPDPVVVGTPYLPDDLIEPQQLWERDRGVNPWLPMTKVNTLPRYIEGIEISQFSVYVWETQRIKFFIANNDRDVSMNYIRNLFAPAEDEDSVINVINAQSFLQYRNAGLCAFFIGENKTRADELNGYASLAIDRATGISSKGRQNIMTRHRPFRSSYKRRSHS